MNRTVCYHLVVGYTADIAAARQRECQHMQICPDWCRSILINTATLARLAFVILGMFISVVGQPAYLLDEHVVKMIAGSDSRLTTGISQVFD